MIASPWRDALGEGLRVTLELSVAPSTRVVTSDESAAHLLDVIATLEDGAQGRAKDDPPSPELQRLEAKIDLVMHMLSTWLQQGVSERIPATMSADGLLLPVAALPETTDRIELYFSTRLAPPLVLQVIEQRRSEGMVGLRWGSTDPVLRDAIDRWVFRMHRREVARRRKQGTDGDSARLDRDESIHRG